MRERNANADAIAGMLPLLPATFHILVALADEDRHGYAIIQDVAARTDGSIRLSPGTLYRSIQRMLEDGLIVETDVNQLISSEVSNPAALSIQCRAGYKRAMVNEKCVVGLLFDGVRFPAGVACRTQDAQDRQVERAPQEGDALLPLLGSTFDRELGG